MKNLVLWMSRSKKILVTTYIPSNAHSVSPSRPLLYNKIAFRTSNNYVPFLAALEPQGLLEVENEMF